MEWIAAVWVMRGRKGKRRGRGRQNSAGAGESVSAPPVSPRPGCEREGRAGPGGGLGGGPGPSQPSAQKWFDIITMTTAAYEHTNNRDEIDKRLACHEKYNKFLI